MAYSFDGGPFPEQGSTTVGRLARLRRWLIQANPATATLAVTSVCVVLSVLLTFVTTQLLGQVFPFYLWLIPSALAPALISPPVIALLLKMARELHGAKAALRELAFTDALTGAGNRRRLTACLQSALWQSYALLVIDLDHFKALNDRHGHDVGDKVLVDVARAGRATFTHADLFFRWGGEEFVALVPHVDLFGAMPIAERFRSVVESLAPLHGVNAISVSIGVAIGDAGSDFGDVFRRADHNAYRAKKLGRNRVCTGGEPGRVAAEVI